MTYNQAFTGCFCECHFDDSDGHSAHQAHLNNYYGNLLQQSVMQLNYAKQICNMENYPQYQKHPEFMSHDQTKTGPFMAGTQGNMGSGPKRNSGKMQRNDPHNSNGS